MTLIHSIATSTSCVSSRAFSVSAPTVCNLLQSETRLSDTYVTFRNTLKTELFKKSYTTLDTGAIAEPRICMRFLHLDIFYTLFILCQCCDLMLIVSLDDGAADNVIQAYLRWLLAQLWQSTTKRLMEFTWTACSGNLLHVITRRLLIVTSIYIFILFFHLALYIVLILCAC